MVVTDRPASLQALWRSCDDEGSQLMQSILLWALWPLHNRQRTCGEGLIVALHGICNPIALCGERLIVTLHNVRSPLPLWQGAHCCTQPICHSWQGVPHWFLWQELVVALLDRWVLLGVLTILALSDVHAVFAILNVLVFGDLHALANVYAISSILAVLNLGVFAPLIIMLCDMVIVASYKQQHESLIVAWESFHSSLAFICYCCCSLRYDNTE
jgi:hypothetical protein